MSTGENSYRKLIETLWNIGVVVVLLIVVGVVVTMCNKDFSRVRHNTCYLAGYADVTKFYGEWYCTTLVGDRLLGIPYVQIWEEAVE